MSRLWLLRGDRDAAGWKVLREESKQERVDIRHLDPGVWAILRSDDAPGGYEGLTASPPADGLYLDPNGSPLYLVEGEPVANGQEVIEALGDDARQLLEKLGDAETVLERLGRAF